MNPNVRVEIATAHQVSVRKLPYDKITTALVFNPRFYAYRFKIRDTHSATTENAGIITETCFKAITLFKALFLEKRWARKQASRTHITAIHQRAIIPMLDPPMPPAVCYARHHNLLQELPLHYVPHNTNDGRFQAYNAQCGVVMHKKHLDS